MKLILGDCLEKTKDIKSKSINMILTDPPYGMNFKSNYRRRKYENIKNDDNLDWLDEYAKQCFRIALNNTAHYVFCSFHNIDIFKQSFQKYFKVKNILVWEKDNTGMGDLKSDFAPKTEFILFLQKGTKEINGSRDPNIMKFARTGNKNHPTEKPVKLCSYLIRKFSNEGDVIFDGFMGSGTTGVSCKLERRGFIGIEVNEKYFEITKKRIEKTSAGFDFK